MRGGCVTPNTSRAVRAVCRLTLRASLLASLVACSRDALDGGLKGVVIDPPRDVPGFAFTQPDGSTFSTAAAEGRPLVLFFGYTNCPDVCPTTLADWKRVRAALGNRASQVRFVFVSVDPERDTPVVANRYAKQFDSTFVGVVGDSATTSGILAAFGAVAWRDNVQTAAGYFMNHSAQVFLVDERGRLVAMYPFSSGWDLLAADLERLL